MFKSKFHGMSEEVIFPDFPDDENTTTTTITKSRRVSFGTNFVKEFIVGSAVSAQCVSEYEQAFSSSDSSNANSSHSAVLGSSTLNQNTFVIEDNLLNHHSIPPGVGVHEQSGSKYNEGETVAKCPKFSRTICFNADSPTADVEFTEGCINLAKSILNKKNKEMTVIIQAKSKETQNAEETKYFDGSQFDMNITQCLKPRENKREERIINGESNKFFTELDHDRSSKSFRMKPPTVFNHDESDLNLSDSCKENKIPLDMIICHLDKDTSDLENLLFHPKKSLNDVLNTSSFNLCHESENFVFNNSINSSRGSKSDLFESTLPIKKTFNINNENENVIDKCLSATEENMEIDSETSADNCQYLEKGIEVVDGGVIEGKVCNLEKNLPEVSMDESKFLQESKGAEYEVENGKLKSQIVEEDKQTAVANESRSLETEKKVTACSPQLSIEANETEKEMDANKANEMVEEMDTSELNEMVNEMDAKEANEILEEMEAKEANEIVKEMEAKEENEILEETKAKETNDILEEMEANKILEEMEAKEANDRLEEMEANDRLEEMEANEILEEMEEQKANEILEKLEAKETNDRLEEMEANEILEEMEEQKANETLEEMEAKETNDRLEEMEANEILEEMEEQKANEILEEVEAQKANEILEEVEENDILEEMQANKVVKEMDAGEGNEMVKEMDIRGANEMVEVMDPREGNEMVKEMDAREANKVVKDTDTRGANKMVKEMDANEFKPQDEINLSIPIRKKKDPPLVDVKVLENLKDQSTEEGCVWTLEGVNYEGVGNTAEWIVHFKLLDSFTTFRFGLEVSEEEDDLNPCSLVKSVEVHLIKEEKLRRMEYRPTVEFGFRQQKKHLEQEKKMMKTILNVPYFLDLMNSFTVKLNSHLGQIYSILTEYPGSKLKDSILFFRLFSFPISFSSTVSIDLADLHRLSRSSLSFESHFGNFEEDRIRTIFEDSLKAKNPLCEFILRSTRYLIEIERESGSISKRNHIRLLPPEFHE